MSLLVVKHPGKDGTRYQFYSTVTEDFVSPVMSRLEAVEYLAERKRKALEEEIEQERRDFPFGWYDQNRRMHIKENPND